jgi:predicted negative regulator of RcsB-dependent stress response
VAKYKKKRARELQHDRFRDTTMGLLDRLGDSLEGKGKTILYGIGAVVVLAILVGLYVRWSNKKDDEARQAMGRAITISTTPISPTPSQDPSSPSFGSERERAQKAAEEFQKVAAKYGDPYRTEARYFAATSFLSFDRNKGVSELAEVSKGSGETATLAKFALAQAKESDNSLDEAAQLYKDIASQNSAIVTPDTANLRLALVYDKQGKKKEAADLLFNIVDAARKAKEADGTPVPQSAAARDATKELERIDSARYAQLTPEVPRTDLAF